MSFTARFAQNPRKIPKAVQLYNDVLVRYLQPREKIKGKGNNEKKVKVWGEGSLTVAST